VRHSSVSPTSTLLLLMTDRSSHVAYFDGHKPIFLDLIEESQAYRDSMNATYHYGKIPE
jgi:prepilin-type processing-associated H-X9-DG protein